ncbi:GntR family transcriptional regulator [Rhodococcus sp. B50]|uniref:GntR family transcriptional regulator n=1 Tax=Rhodococcus sp. B50 TaxID=2682847 RepID=UPI001BD23D32|nr:GntR family transcriptional regulator [Rhodococcus sp. B50]MBS9371134.1 putative HTH-type transcriptional regulator [Rhodococcus sp. B50]
MNPSASSGSSRSGVLHRRPQLSDDVAAHVRNLIMSGGARPGDFVRLDETAAELGVSVTPVREALLTLRGEGLVELVPHRGYVVSPLDRSDIDDIFWLQGRLAERLVERATTLMTDEILAELEELETRFAEAVRAGDGARIEDLEFEFHRTLNRTAGSRKLAWFLHNATRYTPVHFYSDDRRWGTEAVASHERLLQALRSGDVETAGREIRAHFTDGARRLVDHLDGLGVWS